MSRKWFNNKVPQNHELVNDFKLESISKKVVENYINYFNYYKIDLAANEILNFAINTNLYLNEKQPWVLIKERKNIPLVCNVIYNVLESTRIIGLLLLPLLPDLSSKINIQLGSLYNDKLTWKEELKWGKLPNNSELPTPSPIINKLDYE